MKFNKIMDYMENRKRAKKSIILLAVLLMSGGIGFQNCSRVSFETTDELIKAGIDGELRSVSLNPEQKESRPSIEVSTILDNSRSMAPVHEHVASAFQSVTKQLKGFSGQMSLFTTTQELGGEKSSLNISEIVRYQSGPKMIEIPITQLGSLLPDTSYWNLKRHTISRSYTPGGYPLSFWPNMSEKEFSDFTDAYVSAIHSTGTGGSDQEQGLCTMLRAAEANQSSQSFQAFILAANEDDSTEPMKCLKEEVQEVKKTLEDPQLVACAEGDKKCQYTYEMSYLPNKKESLSYSYRQIAETLKYQVNTPTESWKLDYRYDRHRRYYNYKVKQRREWITYRRYILVDQVPQPEDVTRVFNMYENKAVDGYCLQENQAGQPVTCDELLSSIPENLRPYGLVKDSCRLSCQNELSAEKSIPVAADYEGGTCASDGETEGFRSCNSSESNTAATKAAIDFKNIDSCRMNCVSDGNSLRSLNLTMKPGNCGQPCDSSQINFVDSKSPLYIEAKDISSCVAVCPSPTYQWKSFALNNKSLYQCAGFSANQNGSTGEVSCISNNDLKQLAANHLGSGNINDIRDCKYTCSQSIRSDRVTLSDNSPSCQVGKVSCTADQKNQTVMHFLSNSGTDEKFLVEGQCFDECQNLPVRAKCAGNKFDSPNLCNSSGLQTMINTCQVQGYNLDLGSCVHDGGYKLLPSNKYQAQSGNWNQLSLINNSSKVVEEAANRLTSLFGNRFYVAQFVVPPGDEKCKPESQYIEPAHRYTQLTNLLGEKNSKVFPLCLDSYEESLGFILDLILRWVNHSYQLPIDPHNEWIWKVRFIYKNGTVHELPKNVYRVEKGVLNINDDVSLEGVLRIDLDVITPRVN